MNGLIRSLRHALRGLTLAFKSERSFRIQSFAAALVLVLVLVLPLELWERSVLLLVSMFVLVLELLNSSLERLVDLSKPRLHALAGEIKDLMAGGVLVAAVFAAVLGIVIIGPHLLKMWERL